MSDHDEPFSENAITVFNIRSDAFHLALGRFVAAFSRVEMALSTALWHLAGIPPPTAAAVFSGIRIEGAMQFINRLADAQNWPNKKRANWKPMFDHLGLINKLRNDILHYGALPDQGDYWLITNEKFAHVPTRIRRIHVTPSLLKDATQDLRKIDLCLMLLVRPNSLFLVDASRGRPKLSEVQRRPWCYKPPQPIATGRTSRRTPQKPRRPRQSSRT